MEKKYPIGGYAPGNYQCKCTTCERSFFGDKRAVQCEACAVVAKERFDALSPTEQEVLVKQNAGIAKVMFAYAGSGEQIIANQAAGMPLEEAIYQAGYTAGHDIGYERGKRETPQGPGWVKATKRLPGWKTKVKWRDGNNHSYATDGNISLFEMDKPNLEGWEWLDESGQAQPEVAV